MLPLKGKDPFAAFNYAKLLCDGEGVAVNKPEAAKYLRMAADAGDADSQHNYAVMLKTGDGIPRDRTLAVKYFKMAAAQVAAAITLSTPLSTVCRVAAA